MACKASTAAAFLLVKFMQLVESAVYVNREMMIQASFLYINLKGEEQGAYKLQYPDLKV